MEAVLVLSIFDMASLMRMNGVGTAVEMVYDFRATARFVLDNRRMMEYTDKIVAVLPSIEEAMYAGTQVITLLYNGSGGRRIPVSAAVGYGQAYRDASDTYWGIEVNNATYLATYEARRGEVLLTPEAQKQRILDNPSLNLTDMPDRC